MPTGRKLPRRLLLHQEVSHYIKEAILTGQLKPGDRIVETRMAQELGVSQAPVREAIRELEFSGLLEQKPYLGTYVKRITVQDMRQFYEVRSALEKLGAESACRTANKEQIEKMETIILAMEDAANNYDVSEYVKLDAQFHDKIIETADNELLQKLWEQCNIQAWLFVGTSLTGGDLPYLASRHREIYESLRSRDLRKLHLTVGAHVDELLKMMESNQADKQTEIV
ncbi:GntR family transcriptional regulator [Dysosmobacter sp.]